MAHVKTLRGSALPDARLTKGRSGQFFLLGAIIVSVMFFVGLPRQAAISSEASADIPYLALNLAKEIPNAYNLGLNQGDGIGAAVNFTWFAYGVLGGRRISYGSMLFFGSNLSDSGFNVTVFNFYGSSQSVNVTIGDTTEYLVIPHNQSSNVSFSGVGDLFGISFMHAAGEKNTTWARDKRSIYGFIMLSRSEDVLVSELEG